MNTNQIQITLDKHKRYGSYYVPNELFWGLGIERESYIEMSIPIEVPGSFLKTNHKPERYSVNYFTSYKQPLLDKTIEIFNKPDIIRLPLLLNSHTLTKCDAELEHSTVFKKTPTPNPNFSGLSIFDCLKKSEPAFFLESYEKWFCFDGDSIEIMTQNFYCSTVNKTCLELNERIKLLENKLNDIFKEHSILTQYGIPRWMRDNHGFAIMASNLKNVAIFNNGTYHINLTLPTRLNSESKIENYQQFLEQHRTLARIFQWLEPCLVACFGSPDPLSYIDEHHYSVGSQRGAMSRYIGFGTFDTDTMPTGKIMSTDIQNVKSTWYAEYHRNSGYQPLDKVGLDINFQKHWNHGLELRFFDWFPECRLPGLLRFLVYCMDASLEMNSCSNPIITPVWNGWMTRVIQKGNLAGATKQEVKILRNLFKIVLAKDYSSCDFLFADLYRKLKKKYECKGPCSKKFLVEDCEPHPKKNSHCVIM
jgi:hypothetical protein